MSNQPAGIIGTFADFRLIKSRKVAQLVVELPIEEADAALATLGGLPQPAAERWIALARLNSSAKESEDKEQRKWEDLKLSMQAGIRCQEKAFQKYLRTRLNYIYATDAEGAASAVRDICRVDSRSGLNDNPVAANDWRELDHSYQTWLKLAVE